MSVNYTPMTFVPGPLLSSQMNTEVRDLSLGLQDDWDTWTPTLTGFTLGNGLREARYRRVGKTIDFVFAFTAGATSTFAGATGFAFSLPAQIVTLTGLPLMPIGVALFVNGGAPSSRTGGTAYAVPGTTTCALLADRTSGDFVNATTPWTWAATDTIGVTGRYEAA